ncbi:chloride channel protein CLC-a-like [Dorcoceras hygrometricum]|uniref:Chloride channel protein CLC-a-like n=1 Tax=Dorcoceras hygrometricum TaxID=472368 RepID=A0A2Z7BGH3_9LAMI|nr:chloride channel protein CLC-a-like [Dorcoceras hygrometricum]
MLICLWKFGAQSPTSPFFRNGKDPLEDFDYNDPRCNPLRRPLAARTPSHTTAHQSANCVCLTHFFTASMRKATLLYCLSAKEKLDLFNVFVQSLQWKYLI